MHLQSLEKKKKKSELTLQAALKYTLAIEWREREN